MKPCVYTTQYPTWLEAGRACDPTKPFSFRSGRRWSAARQLLGGHGTLPILIRRQEDASEELACTFIGDLVAVVFPDELGDAAAQRHWLDEHLWLQRETIRSDPDDEYPTWEAQYKEWEVDSFLEAETWYTLRNLRSISPLPLPKLRKLNDGRPLSADYIRGYALCHYPVADIRIT